MVMMTGSISSGSSETAGSSDSSVSGSGCGAWEVFSEAPSGSGSVSSPPHPTSQVTAKSVAAAASGLVVLMTCSFGSTG